MEDAEEPPCLMVWTDQFPDTWYQQLEHGPLNNSLQTAISQLKLRVLKALDSSLLARIELDKGHYSAASELLASEEPSIETEIKLIEIALEADLYDDALKRLDQLKASERKPSTMFRNELARLRVDALTKIGDYVAARAILNERIHSAGYGSDPVTRSMV